MRMRPVLGLLWAGCLSLIAGPCLAATVEPVQGTVYVSHGQGFTQIKSRVQAKAGDSVMVDPGGSAVIVYNDRCKVTVQPGEIATVAASSPCKPCPPPNSEERCTAASPCTEPCAYLPTAQEPGFGANLFLGAAAATGAGFGINALVKGSSQSASP
jgi:hypothetical protein